MVFQSTYHDQYTAFFEDNEDVNLIYNALWIEKDINEIGNNQELEQKLNDPETVEILTRIWENSEKLFENFRKEIIRNIGYIGTSDQKESYLKMLYNLTKEVLINFRNHYRVENVNQVQNEQWEGHSKNLNKLLDTILNLEGLLDRNNGFIRSQLLKYPGLLFLSDVVSDKQKTVALDDNLLSEVPNDNEIIKGDDIIDLASLFRKKKLYEALIECLESKKLIYRNKNSLKWAGEKYEIATLYNVLFLSGCLNKGLSDAELVRMALGTFNLKVSDRTMRNYKKEDKLKFYDGMVRDLMNNC